MLRALTLADALSVVSRMRPEDRACVQAILGPVSDEVFAVNRWQSDGPAWTLLDAQGNPQAIGGLAFSNDWSAVLWMVAAQGIGRDSWRKLLRATRTVLQEATNPKNPHYRHRIEVCVMWAEAARFAQALGFEFEGTKRQAGRGGEDVQIWALCSPAKE